MARAGVVFRCRSWRDTVQSLPRLLPLSVALQPVHDRGRTAGLAHAGIDGLVIAARVTEPCSVEADPVSDLDGETTEKGVRLRGGVMLELCHRFIGCEGNKHNE